MGIQCVLQGNIGFLQNLENPKEGSHGFHVAFFGLRHGPILIRKDQMLASRVGIMEILGFFKIGKIKKVQPEIPCGFLWVKVWAHSFPVRATCGHPVCASRKEEVFEKSEKYKGMQPWIPCGFLWVKVWAHSLFVKAR